jgi:hypothetical protein
LCECLFCNIVFVSILDKHGEQIQAGCIHCYVLRLSPVRSLSCRDTGFYHPFSSHVRRGLCCLLQSFHFFRSVAILAVLLPHCGSAFSVNSW